MASSQDASRNPAQQVEIREIEIEDVSAVFALGERLFTSDRWLNLYRTWDEYEVVDLFSADGETCFVAIYQDVVVGFALGSLIEKRRSSWKYGYLRWLGVAPEVGGMGIGHKLLKHTTDRFIDLGARMMLVDTDAENTEALNFFKRRGFGQEHEHVYMTLNLTKQPDYQRRRARKDHE